jgi:glutathione S-transferase
MALTLHYHPLSSFCMKALIGLYETATPFTPHMVNLGDPAERAALHKLWPIGKFPVLEDTATGDVIPESTIIIEYLAHHHPGPSPLIPHDPDRARATRLRDRLFDLYVHDPMQRCTADLMRPADQRDPTGVAQARARIETAYAMVERQLASQAPWAMGEAFTLADCAAAPALFYACRYVALERYPAVAAYLQRLRARPSFARVIEEARPFFPYFPGGALD